MATFKVTITGEYEVDPSDLVHYFDADSMKGQAVDMTSAALIDQETFNDDVYLAVEAMGQDWEVVVEVVE